MSWVFHFLESTPSTNQTARQYGTGNVLLTLKQLNGYGKYNRSWEAPVGALTFSFVLKKPINTPQLIGFIVPLAIKKALQPHHRELQLKWPNDLLYNQSKVGGILIEATDETLIVGIGLNLKAGPKMQTPYPATGLDLEVSPAEIAKQIMESFDRLYTLYTEKGFSPIRKEWLKNCSHLNKKITVSLPNEQICGIMTDINIEGVLILETEKGVRHITVGDIYF